MALSVVSYLLFPYICSRIAWKRRTDLTVLLHLKKKDKHGGEQEQKKESLLIVDSSSAVDGRIVDICKIGFISGKLIIPGFVINELSHLADNDDEIKRNRGRRGLDVLTQLRECELVTVEISDKDFEDIEDTDSKLVKLSTELKAGLITVNYNLNKAAKVNDVRVLNINELSEAVKLAIAPGDRLNVKIVKLGKEQNQGIAYLDNGTMIVVKDGSDYYGKECTVCVTTMLQTASGRMVFAEVV